MNFDFTIGNVFRNAWSIFVKNWLVLIGLLIAYIIIDLILSSFFDIAIDYATLMNNPEEAYSMMLEIFRQPAVYISQILSRLIGACFAIIFTKALLDAYDQKELTFYFNVKKILYIFLTSILYYIIVMIGFVFFIIPGIYLMIRFQFYSMAIIEKDAGVIESLRESWRITRGEVLPLFLIGLLSIGICIVGALLFLIGVIPAVIIILAARVVAYKLLEERDEDISFTETIDDNIDY